MIETIVAQLDREDSAAGEAARASDVGCAARLIRRGGLVAFPTETVYGLGADALNERAVRRIFEAKGRPSDNPLIVHVSSREMVETVATRVSPKTEALVEAFWPGPLALVLNRRVEVAPSVSAGLETVAVRMPANRVALELIGKAERPIAAPSANRSGRPSPTRAGDVLADLGGRIEMIIDGGPTDIGIESTVLDMTADPPVILRPGWVTPEKLAHVVGPVEQSRATEQLRRSPGTRHRHYSPRARVVLIEQGSRAFIHGFLKGLLKTGGVGFIGHTPVEIDDARFNAVRLSNSAADYAASIYRALRELDRLDPVTIVVEAIGEDGAGESGEIAAVTERLCRAASQIVGESLTG
ncbi:MAG TPA: L-threonylcarbamoyladenylate synthase [Blastocatellia bacterium]|nr:L-threonylcarbamoyladenylate synthase [Blastocatellia bacterium]